MKKTEIRKVEMIEVIAIQEVIGKGTPEDPLQIITSYFTLEGKYLFSV